MFAMQSQTPNEMAVTDISGDDVGRLLKGVRHSKAISDEMVDWLVQLPPEYHDARAASLMSMISGWAYADEKLLFTMVNQTGLDIPVCQLTAVRNDAMLLVSNAFFLQSRCGRLGILCYRGTEPTNVINWLTDASAGASLFSDIGDVHGGFYRNVQATWPAVLQTIADAMAGKTRMADGNPVGGKLQALYITGHSLGAAMAALAAAIVHTNPQLAPLQRILHGVYTFGQPMVGTPPFANRCHATFGQKVFRHIYDHDIVPRMPPITAGIYRHYGREFRSTVSDGWRECPDRGPSQTYTALLSIPIGVAAWVARQLTPLHRVSFPYSWDDHSPLHYIRCSQQSTGLASTPFFLVASPTNPAVATMMAAAAAE
jgi:hypothetical protein